MSKVHPYSRRVFRRRLKEWAGRNRRMLVVSALGVVVLLAIETLMLTQVAGRNGFTWWLLGAMQVSVVAAYLQLLHSSFLAHDREAIWHLRGAWGEDNTRSELQRAKRRRLIWNWIDSITLRHGDIDHLVLTRKAGLVAIDSKWRSDAADRMQMAKDAHRARIRAEALTRSLFEQERSARHRAKAHPMPVTPVVVLWGPAQHEVPEGATVDGIPFVAGQKLLLWLGTLDGQPVSRDSARDIIRRLDGFRIEALVAQQGS